MQDVTAQISASLDSLTREFDTIAHNLANVSTTGYKRRLHGFAQALDAQTGPASGASDGDGTDPVGQSLYDFSQGHLIETGRTLDVALHGKGFFVIETPDGPLYTRHGVFRTNQNGQIVDSEGRLVAGSAGPLSVPGGTSTSEIAVNESGQISVGGATLGQFKVVDFPDQEDELVAVGFSCYTVPEDVEAVDAEDVVVRQGCQESSNVQMVDELVSMIMVTRTYEANVKLVNIKKDTTNSVIGVAMG